ncbi:hypothetical protein E2C01_053556 [Portunus trituberculatus]|uniref:Nucleic-acid-binding protein from transposon X-element n=1 Tax=Portunus trituberculatus TaxID=210409 RepID=A0A5B7GKL7_PORTR|nr:hypothetical protein [Portunus trituberculatus]
MSIPKHQIHQEKFYHIQSCFRCYAIEDHNTNACPYSKDTKVCSECADTTHTWKECTNTVKKCINCDGEHRTFSMKCPKRKAIKQKREKDKDTNTYANIVKSTVSPWATTGSTTPPIDKDTHLKIYSCMIHAHTMNIIEPDCYEKELNATLTANNLPSIKIHHTPNSSKLLTQKEEEQITAAEETRSQTQETVKRNDTTNMEKEHTDNKPKLQSKDIQLHIYTLESSGWPDHLIPKDLTKGFTNNTFKFTYTESTMEESEVINLIKTNEIKLDSSCWRIVEDITYRRIRSGLIVERSPLPREERRPRKQSK